MREMRHAGPTVGTGLLPVSHSVSGCSAEADAVGCRPTIRRFKSFQPDCGSVAPWCRGQTQRTLDPQPEVRILVGLCAVVVAV